MYIYCAKESMRFHQNKRELSECLEQKEKKRKHSAGKVMDILDSFRRLLVFVSFSKLLWYRVFKRNSISYIYIY